MVATTFSINFADRLDKKLDKTAQSNTKHWLECEYKDFSMYTEPIKFTLELTIIRSNDIPKSSLLFV